MTGFIGRLASSQSGQIVHKFSTSAHPLVLKTLNIYAEVVAEGALSGGVAGVFTANDKMWEILRDPKFSKIEKGLFIPIGVPLSCIIYGLGGAVIGGGAVAFFPMTLLKSYK